MTDESQVEKAVQAAVEDIGRMDIAINNAGYDGEFQLTQDYSTEMLDHMIAVPTFAQVSAISVAGSIPGSSTTGGQARTEKSWPAFVFNTCSPTSHTTAYIGPSRQGIAVDRVTPYASAGFQGW